MFKLNVIFGVISSASILFPVLFGIYTFIRTKRYRALVIFFCFSALTEIIANAVSWDHLTNNLWVYNIYTLVEGVFWISIIVSWLSNKYSIFPRFLIGLFVLVWLYSSFIDNTLFDYNAISNIAQCVILIPLSGFFLFELSRDAAVPVINLPEFWFIAGVLFYFATTSVIQATAFYVIDGKVLMNTTWYIHVFFNITTNLIFAKAFWCILPKTN